MNKKLSTEAYKGVRDFYPENMAIQNKIFDIWHNISKKYGYEEYSASALEPTELYKAKSGEEIINEQTYNFIDRGERDITLRPEMTPTVARMVANRKRELIYPLRWYSIPNLFRYEQPQRGRIREFWQLNVDIFCVDGLEADIEIIQMAYDIIKAYGLSDNDFEIKINNRLILNYITKDIFKIDEEKSKKLFKLIDKKNKIPENVFISLAEGILEDNPEGNKIALFMTLMNSKNFEDFTHNLNQSKEEHEGLKNIHIVMSGLEKLGITNVVFDQSLVRGADYYTGTIFEIFDKNPINKRSIFGGGRYDDILSLFGNEKVSAVGFGAGDVIARDLIETYGKISLTDYKNPADICICIMNNNSDYAQSLAKDLRNKDIKVFIDYSFKKIGDQIKNADRNHIPYIICIGDEEVKTGKFKLKNLKTGEERLTDIDSINI